MEEEIEDGLDLAAGARLNRTIGIGGRASANPGDVAATAKMIMLFLEPLNADLTVAEIREYLNER